MNVHFCPYNTNNRKKLERINFGDCKVKTIQIGNEWFVFVCQIGIALGISSGTLKGTIRYHLPQQYKF